MEESAKILRDMPRALLADVRDNVATLMASVQPRDEVMITSIEQINLGTVNLKDAVETFHKVSVRAIPAGDYVIKFGETIGVASQLIPPGSHVHVHNVISDRL